MLLECNNLNFSYEGNETPVIEDLSFSMVEPGFKAVFGPSGAGKTSLAKIISAPRSGVDQHIKTKGIETILYSYNLERLPGWSGVGKHLDKVTPTEQKELKNDLIQIFQLEEVIKSRFSQLSMGQQNRINLIRYLLQDFDLLIMDESLANVDEKLRETIILSIKDIFPDKMFLYISHHLMEVSKYCSQVLVFGKSAFTMIKGQDHNKSSCLDKEGLDKTMLEIMNAF